MLARPFNWGLILIASSTLISGCGSLSREKARSTSSKHFRSAPVEAPERDTRSSEQVARAHAHYATGVVYEMNHDLESALQEYMEAALGDLGNEQLVLEVSRRLLQSHQAEKAQTLLERAAALPKATGAIYARLGVAYAQLGKTDQALAANRIAISKAPTSLAGYQNLFVTYGQAQKADEAWKTLQEAASQPSDDTQFLMGVSELFATYGLQFPARKEQANKEALRFLVKVEAAKPTDPNLKLQLADGFNLLGDTEKAAQIYLELLDKMPDASLARERVHAKLAEIYLRSKDRKRAVAQLEAIVRQDPTNPQAYYYLGSIEFEEKNAEKAAEYFRKTIILNPNFELAHYELASALIGSGKPAEALTVLEQARQKFAQNYFLEYLAAMAFVEEKAYTEAIQRFTAAEVIARATDAKRLNEAFYFQFGAAYERRGDLTEAEGYFRKALSLAPNFNECLNYLGYMWAEHGTNLVEAREMIEKALKAEPENAAYLDSMAWVLFKLGQPAEALPYIQQAIKNDKEPDPTVYDHLGDIYAALKQIDKAREAWRKSVELEPNPKVKVKIEGKPDA